MKLRKEGDKLILTSIDMKLGEPDKSGCRSPHPMIGTEKEIEANTFIAAIGQKTVAPEGVKTN